MICDSCKKDFYDNELTELSMDASIVSAHQHSAGAKKGGLQTKSDTAEVVPAQKFMR